MCAPSPVSCFFFFLMIRRPPRSTLFPYTTPSDLPWPTPRSARRSACPSVITRWSSRSEEHTSELQSLRHLVCRLLLEKKKQKNATKSLTQNYDTCRVEIDIQPDLCLLHLRTNQTE